LAAVKKRAVINRRQQMHAWSATRFDSFTENGSERERPAPSGAKSRRASKIASVHPSDEAARILSDGCNSAVDFCPKSRNDLADVLSANSPP
jgi:hypothetical protein